MGVTESLCYIAEADTTDPVNKKASRYVKMLTVQIMGGGAVDVYYRFPCYPKVKRSYETFPKSKWHKSKEQFP